MNIRSYQIGLVTSILCTLAAFWLVQAHVSQGIFLYGTIIALALAQLLAQLFFFLHLGRRGDAYNRVVFAFALVLIFIVVGGSLWIMGNLNGRMMPSVDQQVEYVQGQS